MRELGFANHTRDNKFTIFNQNFTQILTFKIFPRIRPIKSYPERVGYVLPKILWHHLEYWRREIIIFQSGVLIICCHFFELTVILYNGLLGKERGCRLKSIHAMAEDDHMCTPASLLSLHPCSRLLCRDSNVFWCHVAQVHPQSHGKYSNFEAQFLNGSFTK